MPGKRRLWSRPLFWLGLMVLLFVVISAYSSIVMYDDFAYVNANSANNAGAVTQAVASVTFGHQPPFYESWDCIHTGRCSFQLIHTGMILYLATPFYAFAPSTLTLLVVQSLVVAIAAVPLYWLTRQVTQSTGKALFAAGLYLVWVPVFSAFTLHLETLLPVELIGLAALWQAGRYRWGFLLALAGFLTFEAAPVFIFLIGVFFLWDWFPSALRYVRIRLRTLRLPRNSVASDYLRPKIAQAQKALFAPARVRATLLLLGLSAAALLVLFSFRNDWGYVVLGVHAPPTLSGSSGLFSEGPNGAIRPVTTLLSSSHTVLVAEFWIVMLGLVAFLPILSPRSLIIPGPWIAYTFLAHSIQLYTIGLEETIIIAGPIFIGVAYGLRRVPPGNRKGSTNPSKEGAHSTGTSGSVTSTWTRRRNRFLKTGAMAFLAGVVVANVALSPINPTLTDLGYSVGAPFVPGYFDHSLTIVPGLQATEDLIDKIPKNASIAAESLLFPLVANFPYAVVFVPNVNPQPFESPVNLGYLPFNISDGPRYVFVEADALRGLKTNFTQNLSDPHDYGLCGYVSSTAIGPLLLFERDYSSATQRFGPPIPQLSDTYWPGHGLSPGSGGVEVTNLSAPNHREIDSQTNVTTSQKVWTGPGSFLSPGRYTVRWKISASGPGLGSGIDTPVLRLVEDGFGSQEWSQTINASMLDPGVWTTVSASLLAVGPVPMLDFDGYALDTEVTVAVATVTIQPAGGI